MRRKFTVEERQQMLVDRKRFRIVHPLKGTKLSKERIEKMVGPRVIELGPPPKDYLERRAEAEARMLKAWRPEAKVKALEKRLEEEKITRRQELRSRMAKAWKQAK